MPEINARSAKGPEGLAPTKRPSHTSAAHAAHALPTPGATPSPSQMLGMQAHVGNQAALGMARSASALPSFDKIQSAFGDGNASVHRDADAAASIGAQAYAQGTDIHVGPGQEKHLPHEAWHVVQQKKGIQLPKDGIQL
ncbi:DUF4157 domain-containing protein [Cohnella suwonensis]|uniref:DUF4157 domain-containing protein n=1 Tax=Cohnella suwonensis TaxID=696072 RepID=A0ABW0LZB8_9BACL